MKIKLFKIRLSGSKIKSDQNKVNKFLRSVKVLDCTSSLVEGKNNYWSVIVQYADKDESDKKPTKISEADLTEEELITASALKNWRTEKSSQEGIPPYLIISNSDICTVCRDKPSNLTELANVHGFGEKKVEKFGGEILAILNGG